MYTYATQDLQEGGVEKNTAGHYDLDISVGVVVIAQAHGVLGLAQERLLWIEREFNTVKNLR